jgi:hypothetical protein
MNGHGKRGLYAVCDCGLRKGDEGCCCKTGTEANEDTALASLERCIIESEQVNEKTEKLIGESKQITRRHRNGPKKTKS